MRNALFVALCLVVLVSVAAAQAKVDVKWHCGEPTADKTVDVGDVVGHTYGVAQGTCEASGSNIGEKTGQYTEFQEGWKASYSSRGRFVVTLDGGDKMFYTYEAKGDPVKKTVLENWKIVGGTGKQKGAKGSGTCTGKLNDDNTSDWECSRAAQGN